MVREWRHVKLLKRAGRGHDPTGVKGTTEGECAVTCPACPQPGINLPQDWKDAPDNRRCVTLLLVIILLLISYLAGCIAFSLGSMQIFDFDGSTFQATNMTQD